MDEDSPFLKDDERDCGVAIPHKLALERIEALYGHDNRGRLVAVNQRNGGTAPRFHLMRTLSSTICRFRADLPDDLVDHLEALCSTEPVGDLSAKLPASHGQYHDLLSAHALIERVWAGPVFMSKRELSPSVAPIAIGEENIHLLRGGFEDWIPDVAHRRPFVAIVETGRAVCICASVRISDAVLCAGVETRAGHRRKGHAANAVAGWAGAVRSLGAAPFYSTSWDNMASRAVARRLELSLVAVDFYLR
jgi:hypothetical protein